MGIRSWCMLVPVGSNLPTSAEVLWGGQHPGIHLWSVLITSFSWAVASEDQPSWVTWLLWCSEEACAEFPLTIRGAGLGHHLEHNQPK